MTEASDPGVKTGDVLDHKYVVRACIGRGGMGSVFLADQPALQRKVAIKVLSPELAGNVMHAHRIPNETIAACRAKSPHSVSVIECCALPDGGWALVMEYVSGRSLGRILADELFSLERLSRVFEQILSALGAVHAGGLVHCDVKSDNFLIDSVDGNDHVTMIDFGLARVPGSHAWLDLESEDIVVSGTPEYMAPELGWGEPAMPSSDLYAAGVVLYELLTGAPPFTGDTPMNVMRQHTWDAVVPPSQRRPDRGIPPAIDRVVFRALDKRPDMRFPDAATFARELRAAMAAPRPGLPFARRVTEPFGSVSPVPESTPSPRRRHARGTGEGDDMKCQHGAFARNGGTGSARLTQVQGSRIAARCSAPYALFELRPADPEAFEH